MKTPPIHANQDNPRLNELFNRIVGHIREMYGNEISEQEAIEAARNWLGFCGKLDELEKEQQKQPLEP